MRNDRFVRNCTISVLRGLVTLPAEVNVAATSGGKASSLRAVRALCFPLTQLANLHFDDETRWRCGGLPRASARSLSSWSGVVEPADSVAWLGV